MATATDQAGQGQGGEQLLSIGGAAQLLNVSPSLIRKWERAGLIPRAARLAGSERRVYSLTDVEVIRAARAARQLEVVHD